GGRLVTVPHPDPRADGHRADAGHPLGDDAQTSFERRALDVVDLGHPVAQRRRRRRRSPPPLPRRLPVAAGPRSPNSALSSSSNFSANETCSRSSPPTGSAPAASDRSSRASVRSDRSAWGAGAPSSPL